MDMVQQIYNTAFIRKWKQYSKFLVHTKSVFVGKILPCLLQVKGVKFYPQPPTTYLRKHEFVYSYLRNHVKLCVKTLEYDGVLFIAKQCIHLGFFVLGFLHLSLHCVNNPIAGKPHQVHSAQTLVNFLIFQNPTKSIAI